MKVKVLQDSRELGKAAAALAAETLNRAIARNGKARLVLSTGASQFDTLKSLVLQDVAWSKVEMFHLDEYVNLPADHPASFRKYLKERFTDLVPLGSSHFVNAEGDVARCIADLTAAIRREPIDLALVGIGENAHIAFNDPPADFQNQAAYIVVDLDDNCKKQQVGEGWFDSVAAVPRQAVSMSVHQIMLSKTIISAVPHRVKANAIQLTLENEVTPLIPATILKQHPDTHIFLDQESASLAGPELLSRYQ